jgi:pyrroline-5-carboxylate reductase
MPNLAIIVGEAFVGYCAGANVSGKDKNAIRKILDVMGVCVEVEESQMDAVTALSGCAPAVLATLTEAMVKGGVDVGLPSDLALALAAQSLVGTGNLLLKAKKSPSEIVRMVATPGGVTEEELKELAKFPLTEAFVSALRAGAEKSRKISHNLVAEGK